MKTFVAKEKEVKKNWYLVNAENKILGRLATQIAMRLRGKHKPIFTPHADTGDFIVVINAEKVSLTGKKWDKKIYYRHSGYVGGLKEISAKKLLEKKPEDVLRFAERHAPQKQPGTTSVKKIEDIYWFRSPASGATIRGIGDLNGRGTILRHREEKNRRGQGLDETGYWRDDN